MHLHELHHLAHFVSTVARVLESFAFATPFTLHHGVHSHSHAHAHAHEGMTAARTTTHLATPHHLVHHMELVQFVEAVHSMATMHSMTTMHSKVTHFTHHMHEGWAHHSHPEWSHGGLLTGGLARLPRWSVKGAELGHNVPHDHFAFLHDHAPSRAHSPAPTTPELPTTTSILLITTAFLSAALFVFAALLRFTFIRAANENFQHFLLPEEIHSYNNIF